MNIERYYYLLVNLACLTLPLIFSFHPRIKFYKNWKALVYGLLVMMLIFIPWDILFTSLKVWGFNTQYITGTFIFNLPLEELLFFICIPYACMFTYHCLNIFLQDKPLPFILKKLAWMFAYASIIIAIIYYDRYYTFISHIFCGLLLFYHLIFLKSKYLENFILTYLILIIPFVISNGILTGIKFWEYSLINTNPENIIQNIVWYDNLENLRFRLFTMPVDDLSFGLTMLLIVTTVYEWQLHRTKMKIPGSIG